MSKTNRKPSRTQRKPAAVNVAALPNPWEPERMRKARALVLAQASLAALLAYRSVVDRAVTRAVGIVSEIGRWNDGAQLADLPLLSEWPRIIRLAMDSVESTPETMRATADYDACYATKLELADVAIKHMLTCATGARSWEGLDAATADIRRAIEATTVQSVNGGEREDAYAAVMLAFEQALGHRTDLEVAGARS